MMHFPFGELWHFKINFQILLFSDEETKRHFHTEPPYIFSRYNIEIKVHMFLESHSSSSFYIFFANVLFMIFSRDLLISCKWIVFHYGWAFSTASHMFTQRIIILNSFELLYWLFERSDDRNYMMILAIKYRKRARRVQQLIFHHAEGNSSG